MKTILLLCALTAAAITALVWRAGVGPKRFGTFAGAPNAEVGALIARPAAFLGKTVEIEGIVTEQCKAMGCFFFFRSGEDTLRVDLAEVAMKAPMREGRMARVEGEIVPYNGGYEFYADAVEFQ